MNANTIGIALLIVGALLLLAGKFLPLGRLPGDLQFQWGNAQVMVPRGTCLLLSVVFSLVMRLIGK